MLTVSKKAFVSIATSPLLSPVLAHLVLTADYRIWGGLLLCYELYRFGCLHHVIILFLHLHIWLGR
jgi:hypothetical protein